MMKPLFITSMAISFALATAMAMADDKSVSLEEMGWFLFYSPIIGGNSDGVSCNNCHSSGYRLENATAVSLVPSIRQCIQENSDGMAVDMKNVMALRAFILALNAEQSSNQANFSDMLNGFRPGGIESKLNMNGIKAGPPLTNLR